MSKYCKYKNKNVAIYTKKQSKEENINKHATGKVSWMKIELEDFNVNIIEFVDNHIKGDYKELNRLIELVKKDEIQAILVWDFDEIPLKIVSSLIEICTQKDVYLDGFLETVAME